MASIKDTYRQTQEKIREVIKRYAIFVSREISEEDNGRLTGKPDQALDEQEETPLRNR
jgi:hypothetical protein